MITIIEEKNLLPLKLLICFLVLGIIMGTIFILPINRLKDIEIEDLPPNEDSVIQSLSLAEFNKYSNPQSMSSLI